MQPMVLSQSPSDIDASKVSFLISSQGSVNLALFRCTKQERRAKATRTRDSRKSARRLDGLRSDKETVPIVPKGELLNERTVPPG